MLSQGSCIYLARRIFIFAQQDKVILWTRVTPTDSGVRLKVVWEISFDNQFKQNLKTGMVETSKTDDFTVKVDAAGLQADTVYYYRFKFGNKEFHRLGRRKHYQHPPIK